VTGGADGRPPHPRLTTDLLGHAHAERAFLDAWTSGRMPHAWLIGGVAGIGKATFAYRCARFVLAEGGGAARDAGLFGAPPPPASLDVAPDHPAAHRMAAGGHGNLLVVERTWDEKRRRARREIVVDDARRIVPFLRQTASEEGWRIVLVDGADSMNPQSQNAILKLLEEPPSKALLLLTADNAGAMLPTIRSRCRKLRLEPLGDADLAALLVRHLPDADPAGRAALARLAEGSVGRALAIHEAGGVGLYAAVAEVLAAMPGLPTAAAHAFADRFTRRDADALWDAATEMIVWWLARLVRQLAEGRAEPEIVPGDGAVAARLMGRPGALERWVAVWENVARLFVRADAANLDRRQAMLTALGTIGAAAA